MAWPEPRNSPPGQKVPKSDPGREKNVFTAFTTDVNFVYLTSLHPPRRGPGKLGAFGRNFGGAPGDSTKAPGQFRSGGKKRSKRRLETDDSSTSLSPPCTLQTPSGLGWV